MVRRKGKGLCAWRYRREVLVEEGNRGGPPDRTYRQGWDEKKNSASWAKVVVRSKSLAGKEKKGQGEISLKGGKENAGNGQ